MFAALNSFLTRQGGITDPYWANVSMLLHGDGVNAAQNNTFLDGSTNNFTVTRNGNTTQGSFNPFVSTYPYAVATNGGSAYFDGTGDGLTVPASVSLLLGTGDFTIECWSYGLSSALTGTLIGQNDGSGVAPSFQIRRNSTGTITASIYIATTQKQVTSSTATSLSTWYHVAFVRNGSTIRLYINGVQEDTFSVTGSVDVATGTVGVGRWGDNTSYFTGYVSNARMVIGTCLYPSGTTFTPPTAPLTAVTNTALLLGMSNGAIFDNTMLNNLETVANAQISTSVFKYGTGSVALNGTTDYLTTPGKTAFVFGAGDFTVEFWMYRTTSANRYVLAQASSGGADSFFVYSYSDGRVELGCKVSASSILATSTLTTSLNTWAHIAGVRDGATLRMYVNGVQSGTGNISTSSVDAVTGNLGIGVEGSFVGNFFAGYLDDVRITKGICRYPSGTTFTPPTAAFPNSGP